MSLPIAFGVYFICWWLVLFMILPIGVRTQADEGTIEPGTADSAPTAPFLLRKFLATTIVSSVIFAIIYAVITYRLIPLDKVPISL